MTKISTDEIFYAMNISTTNFEAFPKLAKTEIFAEHITIVRHNISKNLTSINNLQYQFLLLFFLFVVVAVVVGVFFLFSVLLRN